MKKRIESIQGLRAILCISIMLSHLPSICDYFNTNIIYTNFLFGGGHEAVAYFFVLSGFLEGYKSNGKVCFTKSCDAKKKIVNFYLFHIPFILLILPRSLWMFRNSFLKASLTLLANIGLLQSWIPDKEVHFSFNAVTWFLSTLLFLFAIKDIILKYIVKIKNYYFFALVIILIFLVQLSLCLVVPKRNGEYFLYIFPLTRTLDYIAGLTLGVALVKRQQNGQIDLSIFKHNILESIIVLIYFIYLIIHPYVDSNLTWSSIYLPGALFTCYVLTIGKGFLSKMFSEGCLKFLGDNSFYIMMSHQVIFRWIGSFNDKILHLNGWVIAAISIAIVILGCNLFNMYLSFAKRKIAYLMKIQKIDFVKVIFAYIS